MPSPIPFHLTLTVPIEDKHADTFSIVQRYLPTNFVVENWSRHVDYADISTIGGPVRQLAVSTQVEIQGHISPYWPNG